MRASKSPNGIPFQYFYPITITLLVLSVIGAFIDPDSNILGIALTICLAYLAMFINHLGRLTGIGSRVKTQNLLKLSAELIKADGRVLLKEKSIIKTQLIKDFPYLIANKRFKKFEKYLAQDNDLNPIYRDLIKYDNRYRVTVIRDLVKIAAIDNYLTEKEEVFLQELVQRIGLSQRLLKSILSLHFYVHENEKNNSSSEIKNDKNSLNRYYSILGLETNSSLEVVKKAYRDLAKIYHPDKVRNKDSKEKAKQQFQAITEAYETIKKEKG